jgi:metal-responsive CopG/Arc/MetJ family transcriptional regulator
MARKMISLRLADEAVEATDALALEYQVHRSEVIRQALRIAFARGPELRAALAESRKRL